MSRNKLLVAFLIPVFLLPALPLLAQEVTEGDETVQIPDFLMEKDEGNLAVDPDSMKPEAYALYARAHFLFKSLEKRRSFWGETEEEEDHAHEVAMDGRGNGSTSTASGHYHDIEGGELKQATGGVGSITAGKHIHKIKSGAYRTVGNMKKPYFFHVLGMTEAGGAAATKGGKPHRHSVVCYFKGAMRSGSSLSARHLHICQNFKVGKAITLQGRRQVAFKDAHTHKVRWIGKQYIAADSYDLIADLFKQASQKHKDFAQAYYYLCISQQRALENDLALKNSDKAVRAIPNFHEAVVERGDIHMWLGNFSKAHDEYRRAFEMNPEYSHAHHMDGMCYLRQANFAAAGKSFGRAIEVGKVATEKKLEPVRKKAKELLSEEKQEALEAFITAVMTGDPKKGAETGNMEAKVKAAQELEGQDMAWVAKCESIIEEYQASRYWAGELEKEKTFPGWGGYVLGEEDH
ncbi:MAG: tetratricopeptide repeat protein, partial [Planctomycetota bacterium]